MVRANDVHPLVECSNRGYCDREYGECVCFPNYEGIACERSSCPNDCSGAGICYTQKQLADEAGRVYRSPWDAYKITGYGQKIFSCSWFIFTLVLWLLFRCYCDFGFRGPDCSLGEYFHILLYLLTHAYLHFTVLCCGIVECPSGPDVLKGPGSESGRDCSGRGICDYDTGTCNCFVGYSGVRCQNQVGVLCIIDAIVETHNNCRSVNFKGGDDITRNDTGRCRYSKNIIYIEST